MSRNWANGSTRAWRNLRAAVLARDAGRGCRAHRDGWCAKPGVAPHTCTDNQDVGHHTLGRAVTGDDPRHIVAACEPCNLAIGDPTAHKPTPRAQPRTRWTSTTTATAGTGAARTVYLVTGPPAAGKTWYVRQHAKPGDVVLDQDDLGPGEMRRRLAAIGQRPGTTWVIRCCPGPAARAALAAQLGATLVHLNPDTTTLMARAQQRPRPDRTIAAIRKWQARETAAPQGGQKLRAQPRTRWTAT